MRRGRIGVRRLAWVGLLIAMGACEEDDFVIVDFGDDPAAPENVDAFYFDRSVVVSWELGAGWDGESFRVYARRTTDSDFFLIAEVTSCSGGVCSYTDTNIVANATYLYFVAAVSPSGVETASAASIEVFVPQPIAPPVPVGLEVVALDGANFLRWSDASRSAEDFSHYRVYFADPGGADFLLGDSDSEGFLDLLAENGVTYDYFVTSVDLDGHESGGSSLARGTPRPDFNNEWVWALQDRSDLAGFRFQSDDTLDPIVDGFSPARHFSLERDGFGWWIVPGPDSEILQNGFETTALRCGVGADPGCTSVDDAPLTGYSPTAVQALPQTTYVMRVRGDDGLLHYGAFRVSLLGFDQNDDGIMIFDWAYQLQPGNTSLIRATFGRVADF